MNLRISIFPKAKWWADCRSHGLNHQSSNQWMNTTLTTVAPNCLTGPDSYSCYLTIGYKPTQCTLKLCLSVRSRDLFLSGQYHAIPQTAHNLHCSLWIWGLIILLYCTLNLDSHLWHFVQIATLCIWQWYHYGIQSGKGNLNIPKNTGSGKTWEMKDLVG